MSNFHNNGHIRTKLIEVDNSGDQMLVSTQGRKDEQLGGKKHKIPVMGTHGVISHPWNDSLGWATPIGSNPDQTVHHGFEHKDKRYKDTEEGDAGTYRDRDSYIVFKKDKVYLKTNLKVVIEAAGDIELTAGGNIYLVPGGQVFLGSKSATRAVSAKGTIDTGGFADTSNPLSKVVGV